MQRGTFLRNATLCAFAVTTSGFVRFDGNRFVGDCETTTDILGPFYRPGSPIRNNLIVKGAPGQLLQLSGMIKHEDCRTPYKKAKVELWHCSAQGEYDNISDKFLYRGTTYCDDQGKYSFSTILPVPYDAGGSIRPAHFHMMVTAEGYQPLVTQLYFSGDPHIKDDVSASAPAAKRRILNIQKAANGVLNVIFDVSMSQKLKAETAVIDKLVGTYVDEKDSQNKIEFFKEAKSLWLRNEVYGIDLEYSGNNEFIISGMPDGYSYRFRFELHNGGRVKVTSISTDEKGTNTSIAMRQ